MTEIIPTPNGQGFRVKWLFGPMSGCLMMKVFPTYELAVEYEIEAVNQMRKYEPELFANL